MIPYPINEIADRYSILMLHYEHGADVVEELGKFSLELVLCSQDCSEEIRQLYKVNSQIWKLESDIRCGKEGELGLEEVGRRALAIRELNKQRIAIKNRLAEKMGEARDIKQDHASA